MSVLMFDSKLSRPPHLFEDQYTIAWANELGQLSNAPLVQVGSRETPVVEVDFGAAILSISLSYVTAQSIYSERRE